MNLTEQLKRIGNLMFVLKEDVATSLDSFIDPKLCRFYKSIYEGKNSINLENGAGDLQDFLIYVGHKINKTWKFDNPTARALGTWVWGYNAGYDTPEKIFDKMVSLGYDCGKKTATPYGPKMAFQVAKMVKKLCGSIIKNCPEDFDKNKPRIYYNPATNYNANGLKNRCQTFVDKNINKLKTSYLNWIQNPKTVQKLSKQPFGKNKITQLKNLITNFSKTKVFCHGPYEELEFYKSDDIHAQANAYKLQMNYYSDSVVDGSEDQFLSTMIHEFSHYLDKNVGGINTLDQWQKSIFFTLPDNIYNANSFSENLVKIFYDEIIFDQKVSFNDIPQDSLNEIKNLKLVLYMFTWLNKWNNWSIDDRRYACARTEKESNLRTIRSLLGNGNLAYELTMNDFKKIFSQQVVSDDINWTLGCYAGARFQPKPSVFLNQFNTLAINQKDEKTNDDLPLDDGPIKYPES